MVPSASYSKELIASSCPSLSFSDNKTITPPPANRDRYISQKIHDARRNERRAVTLALFHHRREGKDKHTDSRDARPGSLSLSLSALVSENTQTRARARRSSLVFERVPAASPWDSFASESCSMTASTLSLHPATVAILRFVLSSLGFVSRRLAIRTIDSWNEWRGLRRRPSTLYDAYTREPRTLSLRPVLQKSTEF